MVRKLLMLPVIGVVLLLGSCDFFFSTPFPQDLAYYDKAKDLNSVIPVTPQEYSLSTLGEIGILRGYYNSKDNPSSPGRLILFDKNLNILYNDDANTLGDLQMIDAGGNYIIGYQNFGTINQIGKIVPNSVVPTPPPIIFNDSGFSALSNNIIITYVSGSPQKLDIYRYDPGWVAGTSIGSIEILDSYDFKTIIYAPAAVPESERLIIFLKDNQTHSKIYEITITVSNLLAMSPSQKLPSETPPIPAIELKFEYGSQFALFTEKGFFGKDGNGYYRLFSKTDGSVINERRMTSTDDKIYSETIDLSGNNRYVFNAKSKYLYHSRMWW